jgi:hypothetical protein
MTERFKVSQSTALTVIGWIVTALLAYGAVNARVAVLETKVQNSDQRMQRVEDKIDRIWERVK